MGRVGFVLPPRQLPHESLFFKFLQEAVADIIFRVDLAELGFRFDERIDDGLHRLERGIRNIRILFLLYS